MAAFRKKTLNVLFIGNSFTARNDVPGMVAALAGARGVQLEHWLISVGGASLRSHWNRGEALECIRGGGYDYVVLQEQSTLPVKNRPRMHESIRLFDQAIRDEGAVAKAVLYLTWARRHAPETQEAITEAYVSIGRELEAIVAPVGVAWQRLLREHDTPAPHAPVLHDRDGSHPTLAGSYLAACVLFGVLLGESPVGIEVEVKGLSAADAGLLQRAARDALK